MLTILILTFIQGRIDLNHENNKCLIISKTIEKTAHQVCCEDIPAKDLYDNCQSDDPDLHSRSQVRLKPDYFLTGNISDNV